MFLAASCCVCGSSPFRGCSSRGWRGMFATQSQKGGQAGVVGACGGRQGQAPQLSNRPGPAGSCNSCPSRLSPPCWLPPPQTACILGPAEGGGGDRGPASLEARGEREGLPRRDLVGVQSAQSPRLREGAACAQGHTGRHHPQIQPFLFPWHQATA